LFENRRSFVIFENDFKHRKNMKRIIIALCLLSLVGGRLSAKVVLPEILSDHAVLQQQTEVNLWGKATPNTTVSVTPSWNNRTITARSDAEGKWR